MFQKGRIVLQDGPPFLKQRVCRQRCNTEDFACRKGPCRCCNREKAFRFPGNINRRYQQVNYFSIEA